MYHTKANRWQKIAERLQRGDTEAFDILFHAIEPRMFKFSLRLTNNTEDAKEVVQEVFLKVWERRTFIDPKLNLENFVFAIAKNIVYNKARRRVYEFAYKEYLFKDKSQTALVTEEMVNYKELEDFIHASSKELPPVRREVFILSRIHGLSNNEIAEKLNTSTSNIKNHIYKALVFLKERIRIHNVVRILFLMIVM